MIIHDGLIQGENYMNKRDGKIINCEICGIEFYVPKARVEKTKYCSSICFHKFQRKEFCIHGHEIAIVGRDNGGNCLGCSLDRRIDPTKNSSIKQFCPRNHDTFECGRTKYDKCIKCEELRRIDPTKDSRLKQFCPHGHDIFIFGRTKRGNCKKCVSDYQKKYAALHLNERRNDRLKRQYGITLDDYNEIFFSQEGKCIGCLRDQSEFKRAFAVDHDHKTGRIRGLLCEDCNTAIGKLLDSPEILRRLANYIDRNNKENLNGK